MIFQRELLPPVTGAVDWRTWSDIRDRWMALERQLGASRPLLAFPGEGCRVEPWAEREYMILPQTMFRVLARHLNGICTAPADGLHAGPSVENVCWLQRVAGVKQSGTMGPMCWRLLSSLYEIFVAGQPQNETERLWADGWG